ncbi:MAG: hypothetical protein M3O36_11705 [Myxococcota bacterium]|nr:hypothetical protein [Myxococcota bacterium]
MTPTPGSYTVNPNMLGPAYSPFAIMPGATDTPPTGGTITTTQYTAMTSIAGCFDLQYGANKLTGTFVNPTFCPNGMEP